MSRLSSINQGCLVSNACFIVAMVNVAMYNEDPSDAQFTPNSSKKGSTCELCDVAWLPTHVLIFHFQ